MKGSVGSEPGPWRLGFQTWGPCCYVFGDGRVGGGDGHDGEEDAASDIFWWRWCCRCRCQGTIMKPHDTTLKKEKPNQDHEISWDWYRLSMKFQMVRSQLKSNRETTTTGGTLPWWFFTGTSMRRCTSQGPWEASNVGSHRALWLGDGTSRGNLAKHHPEQQGAGGETGFWWVFAKTEVFLIVGCFSSDNLFGECRKIMKDQIKWWQEFNVLNMQRCKLMQGVENL